MSEGVAAPAVAGWGRGFPLIGRAGELELLRAALSEPPAVVFVEGEAGVGKSRLVHEAGTVLAEAGVRVLTGFCHQLREPMPFGPVLDALRDIQEWLPAHASLSPRAGALAPRGFFGGPSDARGVPAGFGAGACGDAERVRDARLDRRGGGRLQHR